MNCKEVETNIKTVLKDDISRDSVVKNWNSLHPDVRNHLLYCDDCHFRYIKYKKSWPQDKEDKNER